MLTTLSVFFFTFHNVISFKCPNKTCNICIICLHQILHILIYKVKVMHSLQSSFLPEPKGYGGNDGHGEYI